MKASPTKTKETRETKVATGPGKQPTQNNGNTIETQRWSRESKGNKGSNGKQGKTKVDQGAPAYQVEVIGCDLARRRRRRCPVCKCAVCIRRCRRRCLVCIGVLCVVVAPHYAIVTPAAEVVRGSTSTPR